jgi:hypothetical protein
MKPIKVIITKVFISDKSKDGKAFVDRNGKPYKKVGIQTNIHGPQWLSCLSFRDTDPVRELTEGQSADIIVEQNGQYLNFSIPSRLDLLEARVSELENKLSGTPINVAEEGLGELNEDIDPDSLPF